MADAKTCRKCRETKPVDRFYMNKRGRDGRQAWCIVCCKAASAASYARKKESAVEPTGPVPAPFFRIFDVWPLFPPLVGRDKPVLSPDEGAEPFPAHTAGNADAYSGLHRPQSQTQPFADPARRTA